MSSRWRRIEILILRRHFHRSWQTWFGSVYVGRGILYRRNWRPSGFRKISIVSFFRLRLAPAETLLCIWQTLALVVSSFAIVPKSWRPFADHVWGSVAGSGSSDVPQSVASFSAAVLRTELLCETQKVSSPRKQPTHLPTHRRIFGA